MYAAGVLPVCWIGSQMFVLVGLDVRDGTWSDFAGKYEKRDRDTKWTASREFFEETYGCIIDARTMRQKLDHSVEIRGRTQNHHPFFCYIVEIPFLPHLRHTFHNHLTFMKQRNVHRMYLEKNDIMYVSLDTLYNKICLRSVFKETLKEARDVLVEISQSPKAFRQRVESETTYSVTSDTNGRCHACSSWENASCLGRQYDSSPP
jgi:hypothetical protein